MKRRITKEGIRRKGEIKKKMRMSRHNATPLLRSRNTKGLTAGSQNERGRESERAWERERERERETGILYAVSVPSNETGGRGRGVRIHVPSYHNPTSLYDDDKVVHWMILFFFKFSEA